MMTNWSHPFFQGAAMLKDELVKCPVCGVFTRIDQPELVAALKDPEVREKIEHYVAGLISHRQIELVQTAAQPEARSFQKDVHDWNPVVPMWQRSPKE
jgi:hypothetical protein